MIDVLAQKLGIDKAEIRRRNFVKDEQFPYTTAFGWTLDSGNYHTALDKVLKAVDYEGLRREQAEKRAERRADGHRHQHLHRDRRRRPHEGLRHPRHRPLRQLRHPREPTGSAIARLGTMSQGQGHATTYAQIIATELGLPSEEIQIEEGDTDKSPYGAGTWGSRSTPVGGAAAAMAARKIRAKAQKIAAHLLEVGEGDLEWEVDRFKVKGNPAQAKTMKEIAMAAHTSNLPDGMEKGLDATEYYDPPNMTFPFGAYVCVVDIDRFTGETKVRRFYALDDCGTRINPMIIEGQIHGGLTEAFAVAFGQAIPFDENGNLLGNSLMDYFLPTADGDAELGDRPYGDALAAPSDRREGRGGSPHVGGIPCFSNAVVDAFAHLGVTHMDMPHTAFRVWRQCKALGIDKR